ncbi:MAG TPA: sigma-70 family RNA polymerase sigma factor [Clostridiales bacterium]|nr:sigma-70 family RNA polymerase sigma factor [Clostridiales bacterium]
MSQWYNQELDSLDDNQLIELARENDEQAIACLIHRYAPLVSSRVAAFCGSGIEYEDLVQEGLIGLLGAIRVFDSTSSSFFTFARICIDRMLITAVRSISRQKQIPKHRILNFTEPNFQTIDENAENLVDDPAEIVIAREEFFKFKDKALNSLSKLEYGVLCSFLKGYNYEEIARQLDISTKSVDNALQRIRRKLR